MEERDFPIVNEEEFVPVAPGDPAHELVRELMRERGWRIPRLAKALGIKEFIVRRWLNGKRRIAVDELVEVARLGGFSLDAAYGLTPRQRDGKSLAPGAFHGELSRSLATIFLTVGQALAEQQGGDAQASGGVVNSSATGGIKARLNEPTMVTAKDRLDDRARASLGFITEGLRTRKTNVR